MNVIVMVIISIAIVIAIVSIVSAVLLGSGAGGRAAAVLQPDGVGGVGPTRSPSSSWSDRC